MVRKAALGIVLASTVLVGAFAYYERLNAPGEEYVDTAEDLSVVVPILPESEIETEVEENVENPTEVIMTETSDTEEAAPNVMPDAAGSHISVKLSNNSSYYNNAKDAPSSDDLREFQHGISFLPRSDGTHYLIWSSSGNPPKGADPKQDWNWTHDIYASIIDPRAPVIIPQTLISKPEAQEPASAAIAQNGNILVTTEDGWDTSYEVSQRYAVFDSELGVRKSYPQTVMEGGHSGHVSAVGNKFVVFFSEGWVDGGGVDGLGSGDDVYAAIIKNDGSLERTVNVSVGNERDWWPVVAGSPQTALLVWQRFVPGSTAVDLYVAALDPATGMLTKAPTKITSGVKYYTYNVAYVPGIDAFFVQGSYAAGGGFGYVINNSGSTIVARTDLPSIVRESDSVVRGSTVVQATAPTGLIVYDLTRSSITMRRTIQDSYRWQYMGLAGIFVDPDTVYLVSLSNRGLVERLFDI